MCGVAAIYGYHPAAPPADPAELEAIVARMAARGPDGAGSLAADTEGRLRLGHRRLAIIDLDRRAAQPMASADGRFVISFNGEIYNYRELRAELASEGVRFRTTSDTEVVLELYARAGDMAFTRLRGMFALALFDRQDRVLRLVRDPYGIKPLYYADDGWTVRAASSVRALVEGGGVARDIEPAGVVGFFLFGSVPEPFTCFQEIRAVPAGSVVRVDPLGAHAPVAYTSLARTMREAEAAGPASGAGEDVVRDALLDSVRHHLVADVPVGLFLSSGVDSAALLALMAEARGTAEAVRAVTVTFEEYRGRAEDEAPLAARLAARFGAEHTVRTVERDEFEADLARILDAMDQPTIDGVNTWFVSKAARELGLKVALSGLGGDELFAGYPSFQDLPRLVRSLALPGRVPLAGRAFRALLWPLARVQGWHPKLAGVLEHGGRWPGAYLLRRGLFLPHELDEVLEPEVVRAGLDRLRWPRRTQGLLEGGPTGSLARVALLEASLYMKNQLLRDTDWTSMAHSLEVRVPLVDPTLARRVLPEALEGGKRRLATSALQAAPDLAAELTRRPKTGFTTPLEHWLDQERGIPARPEPWARRWARRVARELLPGELLRPPDLALSLGAAPALDRLA